MKIFLILPAVLALTAVPRRCFLAGLVAVPPAQAVTPGGEFCICTPEGVCYGRNCGGLERPEQTFMTIEEAKAKYDAELEAVRSTFSKKERKP